MEEDEEGDDFIDESYLAHFGDTFMEDAEGEGEGEKRHVMIPLMILVGPLLMHGDAAKLKRRGRIWIAC